MCQKSLRSIIGPTVGFLSSTVNIFPYFQKVFHTTFFFLPPTYHIFQCFLLSLRFLNIRSFLIKWQMPHFSSIAHTLVQNLRVNNKVEKKTNLFSVLDDLLFWTFCFLTTNEADITYNKLTYDSDFMYK